MKKSAKIKRKTIRLIVKNLIVLVVLIAVASVGVRSWFNEDDLKKADGKGLTNVQCTVPDGMEIAIVAPGGSIDSSTVWHDKNFNITAEDYPFIGSLSFTEITGDGISFVKPKITQYGSVAMADTQNAAQWVTPTANEEYLSFDVYMRTRSSNAKVSMTTASYYGPDSYTQTFGDSLNGWSPHTVIGAARMSVVQDAGTASASRKLLWIPAPFLDFDPVTRNGDNQLIQDLDVPTGNSYGLSYYERVNGVDVVRTPNPDGTYNHGYYLLNTAGTAAEHGKIVYSNSAYDAGTNVTANTSLDSDNTATVDANKRYHLPYDVQIAQFSSSEKATYNSIDFFQKKVRVNMWIEGEDPESRSAQVTGQFKAIISLKLN